MEQKYYKPEEIANILGVHYHTILRRIAAGKIIAVKIGNDFRVSETEFNKFLEENKTKKV